MKRIPKANYQSAEQIDGQALVLEARAARLPDGDERKTLLKEIAQLRVYAEAKRWTGSPGLKPAI